MARIEKWGAESTPAYRGTSTYVAVSRRRGAWINEEVIKVPHTAGVRRCGLNINGREHQARYVTGESFVANSLPRVNRRALPMTPMIKPSIPKGEFRTKFQPATPMIPPVIPQ